MIMLEACVKLGEYGLIMQDTTRYKGRQIWTVQSSPLSKWTADDSITDTYDYLQNKENIRGSNF